MVDTLTPPVGLVGKRPHMSGGGIYFKRCVDYGATVIKMLEDRLWQRDSRDTPIIQPDSTYCIEVPPPAGMLENPVNAVTTKFVRASANKVRCPIFCTSWVPDGRRLITGAASGEFTLWNGISFNFESILQGHDCPVRSMTWGHNGLWMVTTDDRGFVKYWQANLNNVHTFQAHTDPVRCSSLSPMDTKLATCSDDGTVRIFDFYRCSEEFILRGHGADVKCVDWHPRKDLLVSGSKDNQQPVKLWDPKAGQSLTTLHAHKAAVQSVQWNKNGNWLLTAARDGLIKIYDIRTMKEMYTLKGHKKEVNTLAWHPVHESLFASGGSEGAILFWMVGNDREVGGMESAHDSFIWSLSWHPLGHILVSGANDHTSKFWCRNRPGEEIKDRYNSAMSALLTEEAAEENYSLSGIGAASHRGGGIGAAAHRGGPNSAITLPPPSWAGSNQAGGQSGATAGGTEDESGAAVKVEVPVLGADIIAETFGSVAGIKPPPQPHNFPSQPVPFPPDSPGQRFPPFRPFDDTNRPPPGGGNVPLSEHGVRGPPAPAAPPNRPMMQGAPPPDQFRPPQRDWHERGDFGGRPEFGRPHPAEFNRPNSSPFSWQRSDYNQERRSSFEGDRRQFHTHEPPYNPYVYRRPENEHDPRFNPRVLAADPRRAAQEQKRQDWQGGDRMAPPPSANVPPPGRGQWEGGHDSGPPPMRPQDDGYDRHGDFPREQFNQHRFPGPPDRQGPPDLEPDHGPSSHAADQHPTHVSVHGLPERGPPHGQEHGPVHGVDRRLPPGQDRGPHSDQEQDRAPPNSSQRPERIDNWRHIDRPPPSQHQQPPPFRTQSQAVQDPRAQIHSQEVPSSQRGPPTSQPGPQRPPQFDQPPRSEHGNPQRGPPIHQSSGPPHVPPVQRRPMGGQAGPPQHPPQPTQRGPMPDSQRREPFPPPQQQQQQQHGGLNVPPQGDDPPRGPPRYNEPYDRPPSNQPPSEQFFHGRPPPHSTPQNIHRSMQQPQQQAPPSRFHAPRDFNPDIRMRAPPPPPNQPARFPHPDRQRPQSPGQFPGGPSRQPQFQPHESRYQGDQQFGGGPNQQQHPPQGEHFQSSSDQGSRQHQLPPPSGDPRMRPQRSQQDQQQQRGGFNQPPNEPYQHSPRDFPPHGEHFDNRGPLPHHMQPHQGSDGNWSPSPHTGIPPPSQFRDDRLQLSGSDGDRYEQHSHDPRDRGRREPNRDRDRDRGDRRERSPPPRRRMSSDRDAPPAKRSRSDKRDKDERASRDRPRSKRD